MLFQLVSNKIEKDKEFKSKNTKNSEDINVIYFKWIYYESLLVGPIFERITSNRINTGRHPYTIKIA